MLKITLKIDNKDKEFIAPFISARMLKKTIKQFSKVEDKKANKDSVDTMTDDMANYIVDVFGKQFDYDQLMDGISGPNLISTFTECVKSVTGDLQDKANKLSKAQGKNVQGEKIQV